MQRMFPDDERPAWHARAERRKWAVAHNEEGCGQPTRRGREAATP
ncbi:MAG: hypothetical protein ACRDZ4_14015 [Egibacteraceae bacterium]